MARTRFKSLTKGGPNWGRLPLKLFAVEDTFAEEDAHALVMAGVR